MLTLFTTAKPFVGHSAIIQRNALKSWTLLHPNVEVILFGDDLGAAETARELKLRHEPFVRRSERGSKRLDYMFSTARAIAHHDILCYVNCDIILMDDFFARIKAGARAALEVPDGGAALGHRDARAGGLLASELEIATARRGADARRAAVGR